MDNNRPNIIFIITDQQRFDTINSLGYDYMDTPHLDRMVSEGVTFTNCHVSAPTCGPSRASLFTGYYPHTTGIIKHGDSWTHSWIELLSSNGYRCVNVGKMHTDPYDTPLGFHERYVVENKDRFLRDRYFFDEWDKGLRALGLVKQQRELYRQRADYRERMGAFEWDLPEEAHSDMFVGNLACWWIETYPKTEPLFLQIGFPGPHPPYDPIPRYAEPYLSRNLPIPKVTDEDIKGQPPPIQQMIQHNIDVDHDSVVHIRHPTKEQVHRQRAYYFANVTMIDEKIGQIFSALKNKGYLDNSIVIFTSDHGDCLGEHGHIQKWMMYDIITRMPLIVWAPKYFSGDRRIEGLCQQMDIAPAILELAGVDVPRSYEAMSLLPALREEKWNAREFVFAEQGGNGTWLTSKLETMVRSKEWKLVHFLDEPWGQLYNLTEDPGEINNLWEDTKYASKKQELLDVLREWHIRSRFHTKDLIEKIR